MLPVAWNDRETLFEFCCPESGAVISALVPDTVARVSIGVDAPDEIGLCIGLKAGRDLHLSIIQGRAASHHDTWFLGAPSVSRLGAGDLRRDAAFGNWTLASSRAAPELHRDRCRRTRPGRTKNHRRL